MEKINIAELLKDCPSGMELDSPVYYNLTFDYINEEQGRIYCKAENRDTTWFTIYGCASKSPSAKCVIFPKGKTTWEGFVPPCKFKDGDILITAHGNPFILKEIDNNKIVETYCGIRQNGEIVIGSSHWTSNYNLQFATEEEKQKLFKAIKDNGYEWVAETKSLKKLPKFKVGDYVVKKGGITVPVLITGVSDGYYYSNTRNAVGVFRVKEQDDWELVPSKFDITTLKPFDKVLVRDSDKDMWRASIFSHTWKDKYFCVGAWHNQCIPYEANKELLGTTNDCEDFYKTWK